MAFLIFLPCAYISYTRYEIYDQWSVKIFVYGSLRILCFCYIANGVNCEYKLGITFYLMANGVFFPPSVYTTKTLRAIEKFDKMESVWDYVHRIFDLITFFVLFFFYTVGRQNQNSRYNFHISTEQ